MNWETLFSIANLAALVGWAVLIFAPRRAATLQAIPGYVIPALLGVAYFVLVAAYFARSDGGYSSLEAVSTLFASEPLLLAGWIHYLAFDLFIGAWIARQADALGISRLFQAPILAATFLFGPVGLVLFLALRTALGGRRAVSAGGAQ